MQDGMMDAALNSEIPVRISAKYWAEHIGRPYQPPETWPGYSYINFLREPAATAFLGNLGPRVEPPAALGRSRLCTPRGAHAHDVRYEWI